MTALRRLLAAALLFSAAAFAQDWHRSEPGTSWTYTNGETQTLSGPRDFFGQQVMVLTHWLRGQPVSEDYLVYAPDGIRQVGSAASSRTVTFSPPLLLYPAGPFREGSSWNGSTRADGTEVTVSSTVTGTRGVDAPAGRWNAFVIRQVTETASGGRTVVQLYFVPEIGIVRYVLEDGTVINLLEKNF